MKRNLYFACTLLLGSACSDPGGLLLGAPCPCVQDEGYICCATTQTCVPAESCPAFSPLTFSIIRVSPASGGHHGGEQIEIWGRGFEPEMQVRIGGSACLLTTWAGADKLTCMTPPAPQLDNLVSVSVHRPDGASVVQDAAFRYGLPIFTEVTQQSGITGSGFGTGVTVWDADLDGRRDVLLAPSQQVDGGPALFLNRGDLHFEAVSDLPWILATGRFTSAVAADFTQDGQTDLFVANHRSVRSGPHLLSRLASRELTVSSLEMGVGLGLTGPAAADFDGDGDLDVVACRDLGTAQHAFYLGRNVGGTLQDDLQAFTTTSTQNACRTTAVADYDRDGDADVLLCGDTLTLMENRDGVFVDVTAARGLRSQVKDGGTATCAAVSWVDVDADGDLDVTFTPYTNFVTSDRSLINSGVLIFTNQLDQGAVGFELATRLDAPGGEAELCDLGQTYITPGAALVGGGRSGVWFDYDLDGDQDLLALMPSVYCVQRPWLYESRFAQSEARFVVHPLEPGQILSHVTGAVAEDLDGDLDLDIVSHQWGGGGGQAVFRNNLVENLGAPPRHLVVSAVSDPDGDATDDETADDRVQPGLTFEVDLDGPDETPDFELGGGRLLVLAPGPGNLASSAAPEATFGLAGHDGPVWVRTRFPDGSQATQRVAPGTSRVILRDCAAAACP